MAIAFDSGENLSYGDPSWLAGLSTVTMAVTVLLDSPFVGHSRMFGQWGPTAADWGALIRCLTNSPSDPDEIAFGVADTSGVWGIRTTGSLLVGDSLLRILCRHTGGGSAGCDSGDIWVNGVKASCTQWQPGVHTTIRDSGQPITVGRDVHQTALEGAYSEAAIWDSDVPDWVAVAYGKGMSPRFYPHGLQFYAPIWNTDHVNDLARGITPSDTGTPANAAHPGMYYPAGYFPSGPPGVAPVLLDPVHFGAYASNMPVRRPIEVVAY